jgi:uncharacterized protein (DUF885 family)
MAPLPARSRCPEVTVPDDVNALADRYQEFRLRTNPTWAHLQGDYRFAGQFEQVGRAAEDLDIAAQRDFAAEAEAIPVAGLGPDDRITREMVAWDATIGADILSSRLEEFSVDPIFGPQAMLAVRIPKLTLPTAVVAEAMVGKLNGIATHFTDLADRHRDGVDHGRTPADFAVRQTIDQIDAWLALPVTDDPLLTTAEPQGVPDRDAWQGRLREAIASQVRPALTTYRDTLRDDVLPKARPDEQCGLTWLADGAEAYERLIRFYTTVPLTAREIHDIGRQQVESLAAEYRALGPEVVGSADLDRIFESLRSDPALHHTNAEEIVAASKKAMAKARAAMGDWFGIVPKADCDVEATPSGAIAFYFPPAKDGSRPGVFFMNTSDPTGWGRYQIEATAYHEGIPGHHLQLAISTELTSVPEFRKRAFIAAYGEGWGLYSERLADEMGLYSTPLDRMGMLEADSMRACRLVVDTGMHALGWSRQKAIDYMTENSPMTTSQIVPEINRYAVTPGQALAYMIGRLEIQRMRRDAEAALGEAFDIKAFHDTVLGSGLMPLPVLDRVVRDWVDGQRVPVRA